MLQKRYCLVLLVLLMVTNSISEEDVDDDDEKDNEDDQDNDSNDNEDNDDEPMEKNNKATVRRPPSVIATTRTLTVTRTVKQRPLECYVCAFKSDTPLRSCLDPTKYRVHTITCHSPEDKCFTTVISKGNTYEAVVRGCRTGCMGSPNTTCCEVNRCNNQGFAMPVIAPRSLTASKSTKTTPTILFFVTVLLVLQTVVKVNLA